MHSRLALTICCNERLALLQQQADAFMQATSQVKTVLSAVAPPPEFEKHALKQFEPRSKSHRPVCTTSRTTALLFLTTAQSFRDVHLPVASTSSRCLQCFSKRLRPTAKADETLLSSCKVTYQYSPSPSDTSRPVSRMFGCRLSIRDGTFLASCSARFKQASACVALSKSDYQPEPL